MAKTIPAARLLTGTSVEQNLTDPALLMRPERLQSLPPCRLSAASAVMERMIREQWRIERVYFEIDERSRGEALYRVHAGTWVFDFVAFGFEPDRDNRTGRITEANWDMMAALIEGETSVADREATRRELPKLYAGRAVPGTLTWSRSNRSFRVFDHVVDALAAQRQPDVRFLWEIGYLMRNTGLDGNGTFNTRSYLALEDDHPLRGPLHAQLLSAYLLREYAADLVDALARHRNPAAVRLASELRRTVGIGNGSALGLLFFINTHPQLIDAVLGERQSAIVEASRLVLVRGSDRARHLERVLRRAAAHHGGDPYLYQEFADPRRVGVDLWLAVQTLHGLLAAGTTSGEALLAALTSLVCIEAWEVVAAALIELLPAERVDAAVQACIVTEARRSDPTMKVGDLAELLTREYGWALDVDLAARGARDFVWYKSVDAEEPRRGPASEVTGGRNWALDLPGDLQLLASTLADHPSSDFVGPVLIAHPELRGIIERVQSLAGRRYHSPHMNMMDSAFVPVSMVRFMNAAVHGLDRTVDEVDQRNVYGLIFLGAPTADDLRERDPANLLEWRHRPFIGAPDAGGSAR